MAKSKNMITHYSDFTEPFTYDQAIAYKDSDESFKTVKHSLDYCFPFKDGNYYPNQYFMNDFTLRIVPTKHELENNILIPGHRVIGMAANMEFHKDFKISYKGKRIRKTKVTDSPDVMMIYIVLFDQYLSPVDIGNDNSFTLETFDLKSFYSENEFQLGDSILIQSTNFDKKTLSITYESKMDRNSDLFLTMNQDGIFLNKLKEIVKSKNETSSAYCQILTAYLEYFSDPNCDLSIPLSTIGQLVTNKDNGYTIGFIDHSRVVIHRYDEEFKESDYTLDMENIYDDLDEASMMELSEIEDLEQFLRYYGLSFSKIEIRALIFDLLAQNRCTVENLFQLIFSENNWPNSEESKIFIDLLKDEIKSIRKKGKRNYNDPQISKFRGEILSVCLKVVHFLRELDTNNLSFEDLPKDDINELIKLENYLVDALYFLETTTTNKQFYSMKKEFGTIFDLVDKVINSLRRELSLDSNERSEVKVVSLHKSSNTPKPLNDVYRFKVAVCNHDLTFRGNPYRVFDVPPNTSLLTLSQLILSLFDFSNDHLFGFYEFKKDFYSSKERYELDYQSGNPSKKLDSTYIYDVFEEKKKMLFLFDFGDEWKFMIKLENIYTLDTDYEDYFRDHSGRGIKKVGESPEQYPDYDE